MSKVIDLSGPLYEGMWSYSSLLDLKDGSRSSSCKRLAAIEADGFEAFGYRLSSITGTYIETGAHMLDGRAGAERSGPSRRSSGRPWCATCRGKGRAR